MNDNVGIIITARLKSNRLPEKTIQKINGKYTFEILLERLINQKYPVVVALPENSENNILKEIAESKGVEVYRGDDDSPLHRLTNCALHFGFDHVVRVTQDDILIDQIVLFNQIKHHIRGHQDYTFCRKIPEGCAAEVMRVEILEEIVNEVGEKPIEFISYYIKDKYKTFEYYPDKEFQFPYRLTMDYEEDLTLLRLLFACIPEPIGTLDIINFLKKHKYFLQINKLPVITVYTCNYNTSKYIIDTLKSILNQTYDDFELIIIDDHSTDKSMNVITEFYSNLTMKDQNRIRILRNDKNKGLPACSNMALQMARGKYIIRVDSDDMINKNLLEEMLNLIRLEGTQACLSGYIRINADLTEIETINKNMFHPACSLISTWAANELKYQENLIYLEGADFWNRFKQKYKYSFISEPLWKYRKRPGQKTGDKNHPDNRS